MMIYMILEPLDVSLVGILSNMNFFI